MKDRILLEEIKNFFGVGEFYTKTSDSVIYTVKSMKDLTVIINHFDKYPLITEKGADYINWKEAFTIIKNKEHLTLDGLKKILVLKAAIGRGLSDKLQSAFSIIVSDIKLKHIVINKVVPDPYWLAGFASGEGCFFVDIYKSKASKIGMAVKLVFQLTQHSRDEDLIRSFINYFECGFVIKHNEAFDYKVVKFLDIKEKIIPFFKKYPIRGVKSQDFEDFLLASELFKVKKLTENFEKIQKIKAGMNKRRI